MQRQSMLAVFFFVRKAQKICRIEKSGATEGVIKAKIKNHVDMRLRRNFGKTVVPLFRKFTVEKREFM